MLTVSGYVKLRNSHPPCLNLTNENRIYATAYLGRTVKLIDGPRTREQLPKNSSVLNDTTCQGPFYLIDNGDRIGVVCIHELEIGD